MASVSLEAFLQGWLLGSSLMAVALTQSARQGLRLWAPVLGLASQPAWLWVTFQAAQWGMFTSAVAFTGVWAWGLWHSIKEWSGGVAPLSE